ncbi:hypothetical protein [Blastococcus sp. SYSU DS0541]
MTGDRSYPLPTTTLPGHSFETLVDRLGRFEELCAKHDVVTHNTRIARYRRYLQQGPLKDWELDKGTFIDPSHSPIQHGLDRLLYVLREVHELTWIGESLGNAETSGLARKLRTMVRGADFAALDKNTEFRNTQFELRIASYLARTGHRLDFDSLTDVVATRGFTTYYIECKRVAKPGQVGRRIKEALNQIEARKPRSGLLRRRYGVVAMDVTQVAFTQNGLTMGVTSDHARDIIQEKLQGIGADIEKNGPSLTGRACLGLWLQIHIPALVLQPPMPMTRFSSLFLRNKTSGFGSVFAQEVFIGRTFTAAVEDPGEDAPRPLQPRNEVRIPSGTTVRYDEGLLEALVATGELPDRSDDHVAVTVWPPGGENDPPEEYSYFELRLAFVNLSEEDRQLFTKSISGARGLFAPLLLQRYRYVEQPPWLDEPGPTQHPTN